MSTELRELQQFYKGHDLTMSTEWLESCIEWCKDGNLPPSYTQKDLQRMVFDQWLSSDLRDVEVASLPRGLSTEKKYRLMGSYCLQMMQVVDISKPKFWQLQRIRNNVAKNTEAEKDFGKRVLQLTLTDGVQEVQAMEFQRISCLNINLAPGTKLRITGPVIVRNGRLMLKEENVKYLGGVLDELRVQFAAENVLARALRLEENPTPFNIDEKALEVPEADTTTQMNNTANTQNYHAANQNRPQNQNYQAQPRNNPTNRDVSRNNQNINQKTQITVGIRQNIDPEIPPEFQVDDELLRELESDFKENSIRNTIHTRTNNRNTKPNINNRSRDCNSPDLFEEMEVDDELLNDYLDQIDVDHMASNAKRTVEDGFSPGFSRNITKPLEGSKTSGVDKNSKVVQEFEISSSSVLKTKPPDSEEVITLDDSFEDIDIDLHLDNIDEEMGNLPTSTQIRNDIKDRVRSPELKSRRRSSKCVSDVDSTSPTLKNPLKNAKKLTQGTLTLGSSSRHGLNLPSRFKINLQEEENESQFSIFKKPPQNPSSCGLQKDSDASKGCSSPPQKLSNIGSPEIESKYLPSTSSTSSTLPQNPICLSPETSPSSSKISKVLPIEKLKKILPNIGKGKFKIKGKFKKVAEKLQHTDSYHFVIVVEDITGELTVQIHSDIVTSMAGVGPEELGRLRVLALQQDEDVKRQIVKALSNLHQRCLTLDDVLEVQVTRGEKYPVVINII